MGTVARAIAMPADVTVNVSGVSADARTSDPYAFGFPEAIQNFCSRTQNLKNTSEPFQS